MNKQLGEHLVYQGESDADALSENAMRKEENTNQ